MPLQIDQSGAVGVAIVDDPEKTCRNRWCKLGGDGGTIPTPPATPAAGR